VLQVKWNIDTARARDRVVQILLFEHTHYKPTVKEKAQLSLVGETCALVDVRQEDYIFGYLDGFVVRVLHESGVYADSPTASCFRMNAGCRPRIQAAYQPVELRPRCPERLQHTEPTSPLIQQR
jgi:hypothetical protein